jgi:hypothetical protein
MSCYTCPLHLDAIDMLAGPRQKLMQRHQPRFPCNLPAVVHKQHVGMPWMEKRCSSSATASLSTLTSRTSGSSPPPQGARPVPRGRPVDHR